MHALHAAALTCELGSFVAASSVPNLHPPKWSKAIPSAVRSRTKRLRAVYCDPQSSSGSCAPQNRHPRHWPAQVFLTAAVTPEPAAGHMP